MRLSTSIRNRFRNYRHCCQQCGLGHVLRLQSHVG
ncbi:hypothetical protein FOMG_19622 [Fusarium oxysporum f. sp. melonis 26406]|uniref:Uncharacterized protein n=1 Tax=Fusarium oxysporum f. sp. melonis 26406 TaxID=1089452 RepID=W9Z4T1_FUSOX|nr:hypothetical protein FOMG_19622 [Fusarium oxysporum f. sp. melonis 26406]